VREKDDFGSNMYYIYKWVKCVELMSLSNYYFFLRCFDYLEKSIFFLVQSH